MRRLLLLLLLLPTLLVGQNSWVSFQVQFDFYAPQESNFFMVSDGNGDTSIFFQPTNQYEYLDTVLNINSDSYTISLRDSFGDGWVSSQPASFKMGNTCQGDIINWSPVIGSFFQRDTTVTIYPCPPPSPPLCIPSLLHISLDQFPLETSWEIKDSTGAIIESGGPYSYMVNYQSFSVPICLPVGPMEFTMMDTYGDGIAGSLWGGQDGSYYLTQCNDTVVFGNVANFGNDTIHAFVSDSCPPIYGCMDTSYIEFNPIADTDTGSCLNLVVIGCTDSTMYNYDPLANRMDLIPNCDYTLTLYDLMGDGWVGSYLRVIQGTDTNIFILTTGFSQDFTINLNAPEQVRFKFFITQQAQGTAAHCGFKLTNPLGDVIIEVAAPFIQPLFCYTTPTYCGNLCIEKVFGCTYPTAINYDSLANVDDVSCYYTPGCTNPVYLEYNSNYDFDDGSCSTLVVLGCMDSLSFNYNPLANTELVGSCIAIVVGCMQPLAFNYNVNANTPDTCIAIVYGCMSQLAINYDSLANTDDGSCIGVVYGCTDPLAFNYNVLANVEDNSCLPVILGCMDASQFNYNPTANTDNNSCIPYLYGCMDTAAFNYDPLANTDNSTCIGVVLGCTNPIALNYCDSCNTDDFSCILPIYGCIDSIMFNFNPLANVDNSSCIPITYGCTDPSALNYNSSANTEDFSCISYMYGCTDSTAINFDSLANTDNGSCMDIIEGCMDPSAYNYSVLANSSDSASCLYSANCISGDGIPYWLNDPCYAWVVEVDDYCCNNEWDNICQLTYNYCDGSYTGPLLSRTQEEKKLISITDLLGRPSKEGDNKLLFYLYDDGSVNKKIIINK